MMSKEVTGYYTMMDHNNQQYMTDEGILMIHTVHDVTR